MDLLNTPGTVWLDTSRKDPDTSSTAGLLFSEPFSVVVANDAPSLSHLFRELDNAMEAGHHAVLVLSYEAAYALHSDIFEHSGDHVWGWLGLFEEPQRIDSGTKGLFRNRATFSVSDTDLSITQEDYDDAVEAIREAIQEGDVYQVNLTAPLQFQFGGDPMGLYQALRERQKVAYGAFANLGDRQILSLSPELFFRVDSAGDDRMITTRPMKGTVKRGQSPVEDDQLAKALESDAKNRAENLMIVDLLRNDLSRIAEPGSVAVPDLYAIERYESVTQMTSTVQAKLRKEVTLSLLFEALFPCGSVTGAPKWSAMNQIQRLEPAPRGVYCGAIGYAGPKGVVFNVPIRTIEIKGGEGTLGLGSGIVWDSDPDKEYAECLLKGKFLTDLAS